MKSLLHILHLEEDPIDAELVPSALEIEGIACSIQWVQTREDLVVKLELDGIDLIFSATARLYLGLARDQKKRNLSPSRKGKNSISAFVRRREPSQNSESRNESFEFPVAGVRGD
jgi:hypothetical protein